MKASVKRLIMLGLGLGGMGVANAQTVDCVTQCPPPPNMIIKIFNDDPHHTIFPTFTTGHHNPRDIWLQTIFKVPTNDEPTHPYPSLLTYRFYINPTTGIQPGQGVILTIPLYTPKVNNPSPVTPDQYIDWWNGDNMWTYYSDYDKTDPPLALTYDKNHRPSQTPVDTSLFPSDVLVPTCVTTTQAPCEALVIYQDTGGEVGNANPNQLLEFTLGARNVLTGGNPATDPSNVLDLKNVDFDIRTSCAWTGNASGHRSRSTTSCWPASLMPRCRSIVCGDDIPPSRFAFPSSMACSGRSAALGTV